jgi:hypothetical protein
MTSSKPPALATWLVEHLVSGDKNEALTGDLMEQFRQGRSVAWYWRQVFGAILVGWSKELRILWISIGVTVVWILALAHFYGRFWFFAEFRWSFFRAMQLGIMTPSEDLSTGWFIVFNALPLMLAVSVYLGLTRTFNLRRFLRGLSAGLLTLALVFNMGVNVRYRWLLHHTFVGYVVAVLPVFVALMVSMWAARPNSAERQNGQSALA